MLMFWPIAENPGCLHIILPKKSLFDPVQHVPKTVVQEKTILLMRTHTQGVFARFQESLYEYKKLDNTHGVRACVCVTDEGAFGAREEWARIGQERETGEAH